MACESLVFWIVGVAVSGHCAGAGAYGMIGSVLHQLKELQYSFKASCSMQDNAPILVTAKPELRSTSWPIYPAND